MRATKITIVSLILLASLIVFSSYIVPYIFFSRAIKSFSSWLPYGYTGVVDYSSSSTQLTVNNTGKDFEFKHIWNHGPQGIRKSSGWPFNLATMETSGNINGAKVVATTYLNWNLSFDTVWQVDELDRSSLINGAYANQISGKLTSTPEEDFFLSWRVENLSLYTNIGKIFAGIVDGVSVFSNNQWQHNIESSKASLIMSEGITLELDNIKTVAYMKIEEYIQGSFNISADHINYGKEKLKNVIVSLTVNELRSDFYTNGINTNAIVDIHSVKIDDNNGKIYFSAKYNNGLDLEGSFPKGIVRSLIKKDIANAMRRESGKFSLSLDGYRIPSPTLRTDSQREREIELRASRTIFNLTQKNLLAQHDDNYYIKFRFKKGKLSLLDVN